MTERIINHTPNDFEAEAAVKVGCLEVMCFQDDLPAFALDGLHFNHSQKAAAVPLVAQVRRNEEMTNVTSRSPRPTVYSAHDSA